MMLHGLIEPVNIDIVQARKKKDNLFFKILKMKNDLLVFTHIDK